MALIADTFTRADGAVGTAETGGAWSVTGTCEVATNQCQIQADSYMLIDSGASDVDMIVTWVNKGFISYGAIVPRWVDFDNHVQVQHSRIGYKSGALGAFTEVATYSAIAAGSVVRVVAVGDAIVVYDDGVEIANVTISAHQNATSQGLVHGVNYSSIWDSLTVSGVGAEPPAAIVEIGFASNPFASTTTWTDVTDYVALEDGPVQIERGRSAAGTTADAGTCTLVLNNDDKRFTPGYTGGPYGANVVVGKRIRITITHNGTEYRRFTGYISSFDLNWPTGVTQQSRVMVTAIDIIGMLDQVKLRNIVEHTFLVSDPVALWPLDDGDESQDAHEITGYRQEHLHPIHNKGKGNLLFGNTVYLFSDGDAQFGANRGLPSIPKSRALRIKSPRFWEDAFGWTAIGGDIDLKSATTSVGMGYWVNFDQEHDEDQQVFLSSLKLTDGGGAIGPALVTGVSAKGRLFGGILADAGTVSLTVRGKRIVNGGWHFIYIHYSETGNGIINLYLDGELADTSSAFGANYPTIPGGTPAITLGAARRNDGTKEDNNPANARFAYLGVWTDTAADNVQSSADELYEAGSTGWDGQDRTSARVTRVLNWLGVPSNRQDVTRGLSEVRVGDMKSMTALEYVNECVVAEQGFFYQAGDGTCVFHPRDWRWDATSSATLTWHHPGEQFTTDYEQIVNGIAVSYRGGEMRLSDAASRTAYGPRDLSVSTQLSDRNQARGIAEYILKLRETLKPRMDVFTYEILTEPSPIIRDAVLGLELDELFTVSSLPTQAHTSSTKFWTEGISETLSYDEWHITFTSSPQKTAFDGSWILGTSNDLDTDSVLGY